MGSGVDKAHAAGFARFRRPVIPLAVGAASTILHLRSNERGKCCSCRAKLQTLEETRLEKTEWEYGNVEGIKKLCSCSLLPLFFLCVLKATFCACCWHSWVSY